MAHAHYVSVCCMFRDEARFLREWIEFHRLVGVDHFYLFDNNPPGADDGSAAVLAPYVHAGLATVEAWPEPFSDASACRAFGRAVHLARGRSTWLALLDSDEFLVPVDADDLAEALRPHEERGGVTVQWRMFGTSGVERVPADRLMIETLLLRAEPAPGQLVLVKSVVRPDHVAAVHDQHFAEYAPGRAQVGEHGRPTDGKFDAATEPAHLVLHHYYLRDGQFLREVKAPRRARYCEGHRVEDEAYLRRVDAEYGEVRDERMLRFVDPLRRRMGLPAARQPKPRPAHTHTSRLAHTHTPRPASAIVAPPPTDDLPEDPPATGGGDRPAAHYVSACCMFRDEARFLREWIEFHRLVGVGHFYLFDNNDADDGSAAVLAPYVRSGLVTLERWAEPFSDGSARRAFGRAVHLARGRSTWLALLDSDEFLVPLDTDDLADALRPHEARGGVAVQWRVFGTSGVERVPADRLMTETLLMRGEPAPGSPVYVKSVVRPEHVAAVNNQHFAEYVPGHVPVNERGEPMGGGAYAAAEPQHLVLHHYFLRDGQFLREVKATRRMRYAGEDEAFLRRVDAENSVVRDERMLRFAAALRRRMGLAAPRAASLPPPSRSARVAAAAAHYDDDNDDLLPEEPDAPQPPSVAMRSLGEPRRHASAIVARPNIVLRASTATATDDELSDTSPPRPRNVSARHVSARHVSAPRGPPTTAADTLVLYAYYECPVHADNLRFFLRHGVFSDNGCDHVLIVNGDECSVPLPGDGDASGSARVRVMRRPNTGYDFGAWAHALRELGDAALARYRHYVFLNGSVRGPFLPSYVPARRWPRLLTGLLRGDVRLAGTVINPWGPGGEEVPHVQSMAFALDRAGLATARAAGVFEGHDAALSKWDVVVRGEMALSRAVLASGAQIDCLLPVLAGRRWRLGGADAAAIERETGFRGNDPYGSFFGWELHPLDVVFIKTNRGVDERLLAKYVFVAEHPGGGGAASDRPDDDGTG